MDIALTSSNEQGVQEVLETKNEELLAFLIDPNINYCAVKALVGFMLSQHINSKETT